MTEKMNDYESEDYSDSRIPKIKEGDEYKKNKDWLNAAKCYYDARLYNESSKMYELASWDSEDYKEIAELLESAANVITVEENDGYIVSIEFVSGLFVRAANYYRISGLKDKEQEMLSKAMDVFEYYEYEIDEDILQP